MTQVRQPKGTPYGGQFAAGARGETPAPLVAERDGEEAPRPLSEEVPAGRLRSFTDYEVPELGATTRLDVYHRHGGRVSGRLVATHDDDTEWSSAEYDLSGAATDDLPEAVERLDPDRRLRDPSPETPAQDEHHGDRMAAFLSGPGFEQDFSGYGIDGYALPDDREFAPEPDGAELVLADVDVPGPDSSNASGVRFVRRPDRRFAFRPTAVQASGAAAVGRFEEDEVDVETDSYATSSEYPLARTTTPEGFRVEFRRAVRETFSASGEDARERAGDDAAYDDQHSRRNLDWD